MVHINRVVVSLPDFDQTAFAAALRERLAEGLGSAVTPGQIGVIRAHRTSSPDSRSLGVAVGEAIGRNLR
ncbi:MAG TPA: hypothetical protein VMP13_10580 [Acidimicrobiia bacterium]|nr:hypothetical protein [Acidimicrobiia bacterium]